MHILIKKTHVGGLLYTSEKLMKILINPNRDQNVLSQEQLIHYLTKD